MTNYNAYEIGETVKSVVKSTKGKNCAENISVKLYFDDELIGSSSTFPYYNEFKLTNLKIGRHIMKCAVTYEDDNVSVTYYPSREIVIIPSE